jgi:hypothetical protein
VARLVREGLVDEDILEGVHGIGYLLALMAHDSDDQEKASPRRMAMVEHLLDHYRLDGPSMASLEDIYNVGSVEIFKIFMDRGANFEKHAHDIFPYVFPPQVVFSYQSPVGWVLKRQILE